MYRNITKERKWSTWVKKDEQLHRDYFFSRGFRVYRKGPLNFQPLRQAWTQNKSQHSVPPYQKNTKKNGYKTAVLFPSQDYKK